jgi:hypothetical protein
VKQDQELEQEQEQVLAGLEIPKPISFLDPIDFYHMRLRGELAREIEWALDLAKIEATRSNLRISEERITRVTGVNAKALDVVLDVDRDAAIPFGEASPQKDYRSEWRRAINQAVIKCGTTASSQELANWIAEHHPYLPESRHAH